MAVDSNEIEYRLSGGASNADVNASLGGEKSSVTVVDATGHNLFDVVSGEEHEAGYTDYRCIYVHNADAVTSLSSAKAWIVSDTTGPDTDVSIGVGTAAPGAIEQGPLTEETEPTGVAWSDAAVSRATGLDLGDLDPGSHKAVWIRRTVSPGTTPHPGDTCTIQAGGTSG